MLQLSATIAIAPMTPISINTVAALIAKEIGDTVQKIVLFGSRAAGKATPSSDYDFAVIVESDVGIDLKKQATVRRDVENLLGDDVDLLLIPWPQYERNKQFPLNIEAKIASGQVLYDSGRRVHPIQQAPTLEELRQEAAARFMSNAYHLLGRCDRWQDLDEPILNHEACKNAFESACFALRAPLALCDIDTSDKQQRWNLLHLIQCSKQNGINIPNALSEKLIWIATQIGHHARPEDITALNVLEMRDVASAFVNYLRKVIKK